MVKVLAVLVLLALVASVSGYITEREYQREFTKYVKAFNKRYSTEEFFSRYAVFKENLDTIELHNDQADQGFTLGVNQFADMTSAEFASKMNGYRPTNRPRNVVRLPRAVNAPTSLNWNDKGAVTAVKDQLQCGSCWSFSATGSMEGAVQIKTGNLTSLSEQQIMDCSGAEGKTSCDTGGEMDNAFQFAIDNKGVCAEADYPYKAKDEKCQKTCKVVSQIKSFVDVDFDDKHPKDESALMAAIQLGPVSIAVEADQVAWQLYTGGIISAKCGDKLDHGVLLVGYGTETNNSTGKSTDYWVVKNSWGPKWGEKGFLRIIRDQNMCGLNEAASYPVA